MQKSQSAPNPDAYVSALSGWRLACVERLRNSVRAAANLEQVIAKRPSQR